MAYDRYPAVDENLELPPSVMQPNQALAVSTAVRDALPAARKWDGRQIYNTTTKRYERWDATATLWRTIADMQDMATLLTSTAPVGLAAAAAVGTSNFAARSDHVHPKDTQTIINASSGITLASGMVNSGEGVEAARRNNVVALRIYVSCQTAGSTFCTMPVGWRPPIAIRFNLDQNTNIGGSRSCLLSTAGVVSIEGGLTSGQLAFGSVTYVCSDT